ncbi:hypothetical protein, partial [Actinocorallia lasiicapitis]
MSQPYAHGFSQSEYPGVSPAQSRNVNPVLAGLGVLAALGMIMAPLLPWVGVHQDAFLLFPARSQTWTALDELPEINNVPGWLALGSGITALALVAAGLLLDRRALVVWSAGAA